MPGVTSYEQTFADLEPRLKQHDPAWVHELRRAGFETFRTLGFPSLREEDWRFTRTRPIAELDFMPAEVATNVDEAAIVAHTFDDSHCHRLVFVNGRVSAGLSRIGKLPRGVWIGALSDALRERGDRVKTLLGKGVDLGTQRFVALNTAFWSDGMYVEVADSVVLDRPIHVVHVTVPGSTPAMTHPRLVVVADRGAEVAIAESHIGLGDAQYFTNAVSEMVCGDNASLTHWKVQRESTRAFHVAMQTARVGASARFSTMNICMGGALVRNDVHTLLAGEGIDARVDGLYLAGGRQHVDNHTFIRHGQPHCHSFELYKGILDGHSRGVFNGRIYVDPVAQKTDAKQENNCMLISDDARINSNPQLEIFADDVKCTHGAAIGKTDDESLFYLRSRGIPLTEARDLMVYAFASEVLERITEEPLKVRLEDDIFDWLERSRRERG
ncbi:MAG TPA: Fe-S cluster assembly protein SufD [Candidatus Krumholzibacteria bacterium]|nr:Fe-S cluster assembly protein SufD [Candidatus Krumholzibacteria bacterium]